MLYKIMFQIWYEKDAQKIAQNTLNEPSNIGILARSNYVPPCAAIGRPQTNRIKNFYQSAFVVVANNQAFVIPQTNTYLFVRSPTSSATPTCV